MTMTAPLTLSDEQLAQRDALNSLRALARKITATLFISQSLVSAGTIAAATVFTIVGMELSGNATWAGLPGATFQLAAAFGAYFWGMIWDRIGRRGGISLGLTAGMLGAGLAAIAIQARSFHLFLGALVGFGMARAAMQLGRFAAAEVHPPDERGRAISNVVLAGTVGAIVGPLLVAPSSRWALGQNMNELSGPFAAALILFGLSSLAAYLGLRPDPFELGQEISRRYPEQERNGGTARTIRELVYLPAVRVAMTAMVLSTTVMVMLMGITSLYMKNNQYTLADISLVFSAHTFGMFAPSILSGRLADRLGRGSVILGGATALVLSAVLAPLSQQVLPLAVALFLLGLGWNFCFVGGSTLLADQLSPSERARTQGFNDSLIGLSSAASSLSSGLLFAASGYALICLMGGMIALIPFGLTVWWLFTSSTVLDFRN
jgi:MFS family permease